MDTVQGQSGLMSTSNVAGIITNLATQEKYPFRESWDFWVNRRTVSGQMHLSALAPAPGTDGQLGFEAIFAEADPKAGVYTVGTPEFALRVSFPHDPFYWFQAVPDQTLFLENYTPEVKVAGSWVFNAENPVGLVLRVEVTFEIFGIEP